MELVEPVAELGKVGRSAQRARLTRTPPLKSMRNKAELRKATIENPRAVATGKAALCTA